MSVTRVEVEILPIFSNEIGLVGRIKWINDNHFGNIRFVPLMKDWKRRFRTKTWRAWHNCTNYRLLTCLSRLIELIQANTSKFWNACHHSLNKRSNLNVSAVRISPFSYLWRHSTGNYVDLRFNWMWVTINLCTKNMQLYQITLAKMCYTNWLAISINLENS